MIQEFVYSSQNGFAGAFSVLDNMRVNGEGVDIVLSGDDVDTNHNEDSVKCHSLVLSSISPYFRYAEMKG